MGARHPHVVNIDELEDRGTSAGVRFGAVDKHLAAGAGGKGLGCSYYEVAPGKTAFPHHYHCLNEEAVYVLDGEGTMRIGGDRIAVKGGDYIALVPGPDCAHQLLNTGTRTLKYLCMSTLIPVDVVGYPDSDKLAATAAPSVEAAQKGRHWVRHIWQKGPSLPYYEGEKIDEPITKQGT